MYVYCPPYINLNLGTSSLDKNKMRETGGQLPPQLHAKFVINLY